MHNKKFSLIHRLLHWITAAAMLILFLTGFLRMYWMNKNNIIQIVQDNTSNVSEDAMKTIAISIREPMWVWHEIFAYVMIAVFVFRLIYMFVKGIRFPHPFAKHGTLKDRLQGLTYLLFYCFVFVSSVTGVLIQNHWLSAYKEHIEMVHKWGIYWFPIFIFIHFLGIVLAEISNKKGIASKMIGGE